MLHYLYWQSDKDSSSKGRGGAVTLRLPDTSVHPWMRQIETPSDLGSSPGLACFHFSQFLHFELRRGISSIHRYSD